MISFRNPFSAFWSLLLCSIAVGCSPEIRAGAGWKEAELGKRHLYEVLVSVEAEGGVHEIKGVFECIYKPPPLMPTSNPSGGMRRYIFSAAKRLPSGAVLIFIDPTQRACELNGDAFQRGVAKWRTAEANIIGADMPKIVWADNAEEPEILKVYFSEHYEQSNPEVRVIDISARPLLDGEVTDPRIDAPFIQDMIETDLQRGGGVKPGEWVSLTAVFVEEEGWRGTVKEGLILKRLEGKADFLNPLDPSIANPGQKHSGLSYGRHPDKKNFYDYEQIAPLKLGGKKLFFEEDAPRGVIKCRQQSFHPELIDPTTGRFNPRMSDGIFSDGRKLASASQIYKYHFDPVSKRLIALSSRCTSSRNLIDPKWGAENHADKV